MTPSIGSVVNWEGTAPFRYSIRPADEAIVPDLVNEDVSRWETIFASSESFKNGVDPNRGKGQKGGTFLKALAGALRVLEDSPEAVANFSAADFYELPHPTLSDEKIIVLNSILWSPLYFTFQPDGFTCLRIRRPSPYQTPEFP